MSSLSNLMYRLRVQKYIQTNAFPMLDPPRNGHPQLFKVRGYITRVRKWNVKLYSISKRRFRIGSFFFILDIFFFQNMTSFGNKRRCLATTASKPCFALYIIHLVVRGVLSMFLVFMYSAEWTLVCYVYIFYIFSAIFL